MAWTKQKGDEREGEKGLFIRQVKQVKWHGELA